MRKIRGGESIGVGVSVKSSDQKSELERTGRLMLKESKAGIYRRLYNVSMNRLGRRNE